MHILDDLDDRSVVKREIRQLCNHIGISFESEFPEDPKFILDALIETRSNQTVILTANHTIAYMNTATKSVHKCNPYANSFKKYYYERGNMKQVRALQKQLRTVIKQHQRSIEHVIRKQLSLIDQANIKFLYETLNGSNLVYPMQHYETIKTLYYEINNQYESMNKPFFTQPYDQTQQIQQKDIDHLRILNISTNPIMDHYIITRCYKMPLPSSLSHSVNTEKYVFRHGDINLMLSIHPAYIYMLRYQQHFSRKQYHGCNKAQEMFFFDSLNGQPDHLIQCPIYAFFQDFTPMTKDMTLVSIIQQLGLPITYEMLSHYIPIIYQFFINKSHQHKEWKVAVADNTAFWKQDETITNVYPYLLQLFIFLNNRILYSMPEKPQLMQSLIDRFPTVRNILQEINYQRENAVRQYMDGQKSVLEIMEQRVKEAVLPISLSTTEIEQLMFPSEFTKENTGAAMTVLKVVGSQNFQNVVQLEPVVEELKKIKGEQKNKKKLIKKQGKKERLQNEFMKLINMDEIPLAQPEIIVEVPKPTRLPTPKKPQTPIKPETPKQLDEWSQPQDPEVIQITKTEHTIKRIETVQTPIKSERNESIDKIDITQTTGIHTFIEQKPDVSIDVPSVILPISEERKTTESFGRKSTETPIMEEANPTLYRNVFRSRKKMPSMQLMKSNMSPQETETFQTLCRLLFNNINSLYSNAEMAKALQNSQQIIDKIVDFHKRKDYFTPAKQEHLLLGLIEEMYWYLRKLYSVEWKSDEVPQRIRQTSLPRPQRSISLKNLKRIKDMNVEKRVSLVIQKKMRGQGGEVRKIPRPLELYMGSSATLKNFY